MASANPISFLFLVLTITLLSPQQILAREPQLFNKVTHSSDPNSNNDIVINNDDKQTEPDQASSTKQEDQQVPSFRPQTQTGYGLFGHESTTSDPNKIDENPIANNNVYRDTGREDERRFNNMEDLMMAERAGYVHSTRANMNFDRRRQNNMGTDDPYYYHNNNNNNNYYHNNVNNGRPRYNVQQQGMSDTRFMENGKYFYDLNKEIYDPSAYQNMRAVALSNNVYNTGAHDYGNSNDNDDSSYEYNSSMERYRNQENEDEQYMP